VTASAKNMILITGGGGFLGLNIARCFVERGQKVLIVQRRPVSCPPLLADYWESHVVQEVGTVQDLPFLLGLIKKHDVESIVHGAFSSADLAGGPFTVADNSLHQLVDVQVNGSINVFEAARLSDLRRVTLLSSGSIYDAAPGEPEDWREDANLPAVTFAPISNTKKACEQIGLLYAKTYGLRFVSLRIGLTFGPGSTRASDSFLAMIMGALAGKPTDLSSVPANVQWPLVYSKDVGVGTALVHQAERPRHYIYNLMNRWTTSMQEFAAIVKSHFPDAQISLGPPAPGARPAHDVPMERYRKEFGFVPCEIEAGAAAFIEWCRSGRY
jgi:nucleoside-diphosphate-sugar epimerase